MKSGSDLLNRAVLGQPRGTAQAAWRLGARGAVSRACTLILLALVLPLGIMLAIITPLGGVADEAAHVLRADSLGHGEVFAYRAMERLPDGTQRQAAGVNADPGLLAAMMVHGPGERVTPARIAAARAARWAGHRRFAEITPLAVYLPIFYLPAAVSMRAAQMAGGSPADAVYAGRFINLFVYALMGFLALRVARFGHGLLLLALALPMEVSLAASLNQDGLLIATTILAFALLTRDWDEPGERAGPSLPPSWIVAGLLLAFVSLAKLPYAGLLLLLALPQAGRPRALVGRCLMAGLLALPALAWTAYAMRHISLPWPPLPPYHPGPLWPGPRSAIFTTPDAAAQLRVLLAAPWRMVTLSLGNAVRDHALPLQAIGVLGFLTLRLPLWLYGLWSLALLGAVFANGSSATRQNVAPVWRGGIILLILGLITIGIDMSQYLTWTRVGAAQVVGPSGRYFLPLLPAIAFILPQRLRNLPLGRAGLATGLGLALVALAALGSLGGVPPVVLGGFYAP